MAQVRERLASVSLGSAKEIGLRLVAEGRYENLSEACRAGLRRLAEDQSIIDRLNVLGDESVVSGSTKTLTSTSSSPRSDGPATGLVQAGKGRVAKSA